MKKHLTVVFGENKKGLVKRNIWKKRSVFFYLSYWSSLDVTHCLYVMYMEKNVCDSLIGTLIRILEKCV